MKKILITALKVGFAAGLIAWLVHTDKLEFRSLRIFIDRPDVLAFHVFNYVMCCMVLGVIRWNVLMRALDLEVSLWRTLQLQMIGFFFNTAVPGAVGGDIVKAVYVMREQKAQRKTPALLTVLLDRIIGVVALLIIAGGAVLLNWDFVEGRRAVWPLAAMAVGGLVAMMVGAVAVFYPFKEGRDPFLKLLDRKLPGFAMLKSVYEATRSYRSKPGALALCVSLSILIQGINTAYTMYVSAALIGVEPDPLTFAMIYPLAVLTTAVPLAPGGMGVGHVAFDSFYRLVGWSGGANVFNVVILGTLAMHLLGVIPYLFFRSRVPQEEVAELEAMLVTRG